MTDLKHKLALIHQIKSTAEDLKRFHTSEEVAAYVESLKRELYELKMCLEINDDLSKRKDNY